ncbi:MAG: transposase zinc-binding domain-containing protein [Verrucomicrobiales bacterium]|nr:transposase zinc-binding domain-containing protein [Verrucomicrobiales bacterium]
MGPLRPEAVAAVQAYYRCGDLTTGFTRYHCPDCGHERLLAFTCKARHICPACYQRRTRQNAEWISTYICHPVPHRQFVFTIPKVLRSIFRKRRRLLTRLFQTATACLRDHFRARLQLPKGRVAAAAALHTFGDYLVFHPHLHILAADGLFNKEGRFHCMPTEDLAPLTDLFRARFLHALHNAKLISDAKLADLLSWKHSGFHVHADDAPVGPRDLKGRQRLAEYLLRAPFSLQKIHWNPTTRTVIYRSRRSWNTKRNFEVFPATILRFHGEASNGRPSEGSRAWRMPFVAFGLEGRRRRVAHAGGLSQFDGMFYAYILRSEQNPERLYYGFSSDLKKRLNVHNQGGNHSTKTGVPWTLAWYGGFESESVAIDFERYLKTASGKAFARRRLLRT